jgi:hypothetical protein
VDPVTALNLMLQHWNDRCSPPWSPDELQVKVDNAYRYAENEPGCRKTAQEEFTAWYPPDHPLNFTVAKWMEFDLPEPDYLLGNLFSTTTRALIVGPTGRGKTHLGMALAFAMANGTDFLHWKAHRAARRVMYVDGEMSARLARSRLREAINRHGRPPENLIVINRHFFPDMPPLNTEPGQKFIDDLIAKAGGVDFVIFDNIQSLLSGVMKEEESWTTVVAWTRTLTNRAVGQLWLHHTGIDESRSYGTKTREWQMDAVAIMRPRNDQNDALIDFDLEFTKARERDQHNRNDFATVRICLGSDDQWRTSIVPAGSTAKNKLAPLAAKFLAALTTAMTAHGLTGKTFPGAPKTVTLDQWRDAAVASGLLEKGTPASRSALFSNNKRALITADIIVVQDDRVWMKGDVFEPIETDNSRSADSVFGDSK